MQTWPRVAIIVLNWNGWQDTIECLESLQQITYPAFDIVVVDNGSTDGSLSMIKSWAKGNVPVISRYVEYSRALKPVQWIEYDRAAAERGGIPEEEARLEGLPDAQKMVLIQTGNNLGFAEGNNVGLRYVLKRPRVSSHICLLNNDTVVEPDFLDWLVGCAESDPQIGIVGGKILRYDDPDRIWYAGGRVSLLGRGPGYVFAHQGKRKDEAGNEVCRIGFVTGCLLFVRRQVLESIGLLDPFFFFGGEDADFSLRAARSGFRLMYEPRAIIYHRAARTYDKNSFLPMFYVYRGKAAFVKKYVPHFVWGLWMVGFFLYVGFVAPIRALARSRSLQVACDTARAGMAALRDVVSHNRGKA